MGWVMRALGGMPVVRRENRNVVDSMVEAFDTKQDMALLVPTEGTRAYSDYWKSGFYHIARLANVPIVPSYLDFGQRRGGFGLRNERDALALHAVACQERYRGAAVKEGGTGGQRRVRACLVLRHEGCSTVFRGRRG